MNLPQIAVRIFTYWIPLKNFSDVTVPKNSHYCFLEPWAITLLKQYEENGIAFNHEKEVIPFFFSRVGAENALYTAYPLMTEAEAIKAFVADLRLLQKGKELWLFAPSELAIEIATHFSDLDVAWYGAGTQPVGDSRLMRFLPSTEHYLPHDEVISMPVAACPQIVEFNQLRLVAG